jgi:hypothetical protein
VREPVQPRKRPAAQPAAELGRAFEQQYPKPGLGEPDRADETVGTGPYDDSVDSAAGQPWIPSETESDRMVIVPPDTVALSGALQ